MVYVRGVELTGKTETFELEFPYSSSLAYAVPFYIRLFRRMLNVCFCLGTLIFSTLDRLAGAHNPELNSCDENKIKIQVYSQMRNYAQNINFKFSYLQN